MEEFYSLGKVITLIGLLAQIGMLWLQVSAFNRHRQHFFFLLCVASTLFLVYTVLLGLPYFFLLSTDLTLLLLKISIGLMAIGVALGLYGTAQLFKAYGAAVSQPEK